MRSLDFIRAGLDFDLLVAERVEDILPMLEKTAAAVPEHDKRMKAIEPERL